MINEGMSQGNVGICNSGKRSAVGGRKDTTESSFNHFQIYSLGKRNRTYQHQRERSSSQESKLSNKIAQQHEFTVENNSEACSILKISAIECS